MSEQRLTSNRFAPQAVPPRARRIRDIREPLPLQHVEIPKPSCCDLHAHICGYITLIADNTESVRSIKCYLDDKPEYHELLDILQHLTLPYLESLELEAYGSSFLLENIDLEERCFPRLTRYAAKQIRSPFNVFSLRFERLVLPTSLTSLEVFTSDLYLRALLSALERLPHLEKLVCDGALRQAYHDTALMHDPEYDSKLDCDNALRDSRPVLRLANLKTLCLSEYHPGLLEWFFQYIELPSRTDITLDIPMTVYDIQGLPTLHLQDTLSRHLHRAMDAHWKYSILEHYRNSNEENTWHRWVLRDPSPMSDGMSKEWLNERPGTIVIQERLSANEYNDPVGSIPSTAKTFEGLMRFDYVLCSDVRDV